LKCVVGGNIVHSFSGGLAATVDNGSRTISRMVSFQLLSSRPNDLSPYHRRELCYTSATTVLRWPWSPWEHGFCLQPCAMVTSEVPGLNQAQGGVSLNSLPKLGQQPASSGHRAHRVGRGRWSRWCNKDARSSAWNGVSWSGQPWRCWPKLHRWV